MNTRKIGKTGEDMAVRYLKKHGYKILQRNYTAPHGEIDVIAKDGDYVVFVEVKRRFSTKYGLPREAVTVQKQQTIAFCAKLWLTQNKLYGVPTRFDVVDILEDGSPAAQKSLFKKAEITLIKDAFRM